jgi:hypothetical protein
MHSIARTFAPLGLVFCAALTACHSDDAKTEPAASAESAKAEAPAGVAAGDKAAEAASGSATAEKSAAPAGLEWKDMKHDDRAAYMKSVVLPTMKPEFVKFDPEDFREMKCGTCHGASARDKTFKMPNPKLRRLPQPGDEAGWKALQAKEPEAVKFMHEVVVPKMAQMLGEPQYDPATQKGFGCFRCHTALR